MALPDLSSLPPWAVAIFVACLAVVYGVIHFGKQQGGRSGNSGDGTKSVELAMATFDTTAIKQIASAIEALNISIVEQNRILREQGRDFSKELHELREEVRKQGENLSR